MTNEEQIAYDLAVENHSRAMDRVAELERELAATKQGRESLAQSERVPEGWQLVPKVATPEMKAAIRDELDRQGFDSDLVETQSLYYAGIAAAPSPSKQGGV